MTNYKQMGEDLGELLDSKQRAYGNVFSATPAIIGLLFPGGIPVLAYRDVLTITRILDKIGRICTAAGRGDPMGEDPYRDIAGYAMLALGQREARQKQDELNTEEYLSEPGPGEKPEPQSPQPETRGEMLDGRLYAAFRPPVLIGPTTKTPIKPAPQSPSPKGGTSGVGPRKTIG